MAWKTKIQEIQERLKSEKIDGWLLYDFQGNNSLARDFLQVPSEVLMTRRSFYWIPAVGDPLQLVSVIESHVLSHLPGECVTYLTWQQMQEALKKLLKQVHRIAMEYSPNQAIPSLSKVDAGLIELIRSFSVEVVSSGSLLQAYTCVLDEEQLQLHLEAAHFLDQVVAKAWEKIRSAVHRGDMINEHQVREFIADQMTSEGFMTEGLPICAVNAHSANPHFEPDKHRSSPIRRGDFVLIDLWCKKKHPKAIYGDITRVAVIDSSATDKQLKIFSLVRSAQKAATDFVMERYAKGQKIQGCEVDQVCSQVIEKGGYGPYFTHRTGHNI